MGNQIYQVNEKSVQLALHIVSQTITYEILKYKLEILDLRQLCCQRCFPQP